MAEHQLLKFFTSQALDELTTSARSLKSAEDWLGRLAVIAGDPDAVMGQDWQYGSDFPTLVPSAEADARNAESLHRYLGKLTPMQASDRRLWAHLSTVVFRSYVVDRWSLASGGTRDGWRSRVEERWLLRSQSRGALTRSAISRLWWAAELTHDPRFRHPQSALSGDPYAYTRILMAKQDRYVGIMERELGIRGDLLFAVLDQLAAFGEDKSELYAREFAKELTLIGGYRELVTLQEDDLRFVVQDISDRVRLMVSN